MLIVSFSENAKNQQSYFLMLMRCLSTSDVKDFLSHFDDKFPTTDSVAE